MPVSYTVDAVGSDANGVHNFDFFFFYKVILIYNCE